MSLIEDYKKFYKPARLEELFPPGMFGGNTAAGEPAALGALKIIEELIMEGSARNAVYSKFALLQTFPRSLTENDRHDLYDEDFDTIGEYLKSYAKFVCPQWYWDFIDLLSDAEIEVFLKNYLIGHETLGTMDGVEDLVRTMLEAATNTPVKVRLKLMSKDLREIESDNRSLLGKQHSELGQNFLIGRSFNCRPRYLNLYIGPIYYATLEILQEKGWAVETDPGEKLYRLVQFTEPYFLKTKIHIILATHGFTLGEAVLGSERLGVEYTMHD